MKQVICIKICVFELEYKHLHNPEQVNIVPTNVYSKFAVDSLGSGIYLETEIEVEREVNWQLLYLSSVKV